MKKIYIIIEANGYDGFEYPGDHFYIDEAKAQKECDRLNVQSSSKRDYFMVHEMELKD